MASKKRKRNLRSFAVGDIYQDCAYHPVLCTEVNDEGHDVSLAGVSLLDGSSPRCCSVRHCGPRKMTSEEVARRIRNRDKWLAAERAFRESEQWNVSAYDELLAQEGSSND
ncbi:MAG: hypothetical protein HY711_00110 [Candidatus Melainabacteria bacterium]|nr:hypothetical protein [Candidatus Melainabacteria bacterium]